MATDSTTARRTLVQAMSATRGGAVALILPTNVQMGTIDVRATDPGVLADSKRAHKPARAAAIDIAAALLARAADHCCFLQGNDMPVTRSMFPDVDFAPVAEAFGFQAATCARSTSCASSRRCWPSRTVSRCRR
ncbi:MAG TPA: hypothetical protein VNG69_02745 [Casimicrobiaceae bacterium]|nr:hypothetical protein [Casimicrobiaceae bacterium]